jgi:hypothetical protein
MGNERFRPTIKSQNAKAEADVSKTYATSGLDMNAAKNFLKLATALYLFQDFYLGRAATTKGTLPSSRALIIKSDTERINGPTLKGSS